MAGPFAPLRPADAPTRDDHPRCSTFKWIGQSWESCEGCGKSLEDHPYDPPYGGTKPLFHVREYVSYLGWHWAPVGGFVRTRRVMAGNRNTPGQPS